MTLTNILWIPNRWVTRAATHRPSSGALHDGLLRVEKAIRALERVGVSLEFLDSWVAYDSDEQRCS